MDPPANLAVIPMQDFLGLGQDARMNRPARNGGIGCGECRQMPLIQAWFRKSTGSSGLRLVLSPALHEWDDRHSEHIGASSAVP